LSAWQRRPQQGGHHLAYEVADLRKRRQRIGAPPTFELQEGERYGSENRVMIPTGVAAAFEMIESRFALRIPILHFGRQAAARNADGGLQGVSGGRLLKLYRRSRSFSDS